MKTNPKSVYSVRISDELKDELKVIANKQNRSLSNLIETVLKDYALQLAQNNSTEMKGINIATLKNNNGAIGTNIGSVNSKQKEEKN